MSSNEWKEIALGDIAKIIDSLHKTPTYSEHGYPMIRVTDIKGGYLKLENALKVPKGVYEEFSKKYKAVIDDIVFSRVGSYGISSLVKNSEPFCLGQNTVFIVPKINKRYVYYFLNSSDAKNQIEKLVVGSTQKTISLKSIKEIKLKLPEEKVQSKIASILSSLDEKIELNRQTSKTLEAMAQALFKEWFVDFNFPAATGEMQDSELGEIPKGWKVRKLGDVYKTTSGGTPSRSKPEYYENGTIRWVKSKELDNSFIIETEEKITNAALKNSSAKLLPRHSVLIAMYGATVGEVGIISIDATCNQAICAFIPNDNYPYTFIFQFLKNNKAYIISRAVGSAQQNISQDLLKKIDIVLPPIAVLNQYHQTANSLFGRIENNEFEIKTLTQLRDILLQKLMKGEINIE